MSLTLNDFELASKRISGILYKTPMVSARTFSEMTNNEVYLKCENQQKTGAFKIRGAYNKISKIAEEGKIKNVIAASAGNHAQGVAYAAKVLGLKSIIVMPETAPFAKQDATARYGAEVILAGNFFDDAFKKALEVQKATGAEFIHPFDDLDVIAGQGTIGIEILRDMPFVDVIIVPVGGGGLISGIAAYIKHTFGHVRIIGVQAKNCSPIVSMFNGKEIIMSEMSSTIADGIAVKKPGGITMGLINQYVDDVISVSETEIAKALLLLLERKKMLVEPSGATTLAALLSGKADLYGKKVVCVLSGGNIDISKLNSVLEMAR